MMFGIPSLLLTAFFIPVALADAGIDALRTGEYYTSIPLWRSGAGTNIVSVGLGSPAQDVNLTVSTNVEFIMVATDQCVRCIEAATEYFTEDSVSIAVSEEALSYTTIYPAGSLDTLLLSAIFAEDIITDERGDTENPRPIALVSALRRDAATPAGGTETEFSAGSLGFWGLGIYQPRKSSSILPDMMTVTTQGQPSDATSYTVGFDIATYSNAANSQAGTIHWGAVPSGAYHGEFNWIGVNTSVAGGWGVQVDRMRVESTVVDTSTNYGSLDPGFDGIYVPTSVAESFFDAVPEASRDLVDTSRWNLPCGTNISMTVTISGHEYNVAASELVQPRDIAGRTCWSSIIAWSNGSVPEEMGEVRLGTPFMSGVYSALYYSENQPFVGIAGKPGSVNALNVNNGGGKANTKLAGILIGTLLTVFILLFVICYSRNRNSFQSVWYRAIRRQHRYQSNAFIRGATMPPPMMMPPPAPMMRIPPMGMPSMNSYGRPIMGMPPPMSNMMYGPPAYQPPLQPPHMPQQQYPQQGQQIPSQPMPAAVEPQQRGIYSPRQQAPNGFPLPLATGPNTPSAMFRPAQEQQPGLIIPPQASHQLGSSKSLRWSPVAAAGKSVPVLPAASQVRPSHAGQQGWTDQGKLYDEWLREYPCGVGDPQRYPAHRPTRTQTQFSTPTAQMLPQYKKPKRSPWSWGKKSKGMYSPVQPGNEYEASTQSQMHTSDKRRSWFGGKRMCESERGSMKQNEAMREREALNRENVGVEYR